MPFLREHKVHTATQQSHEELKDTTGNQDKVFKAHPIDFRQSKLSQLVIVLGTHNIQLVKMARRQVRIKTFLYYSQIYT